MTAPLLPTAASDAQLSARLPFTSPWLLAPMEGITEPCFRALVLGCNAPGALGGAFTEFARVTDHPLSRRVLREHLGERRDSRPVGLQLMGSDREALAETARRAVEAGAALIDLNFGCPARGALRGCAGSALLDDPPRIEELVRACADAVHVASGSRIPVTAKIRSGVEDDSRVEDIARAVAGGGAAMLTVHCRTRREGYQEQVDWSRIARAVRAIDIPVCGNGGVAVHADLGRMRERTGCALVMVGRGALVDPWIFSGGCPSPAAALEFLHAYAAAMLQRSHTGASGAARRLKQLFHHFAAGGLIAGERASWLGERDPGRLLARLRDLPAGGAQASGERAPCRPPAPAAPGPEQASGMRINPVHSRRTEGAGPPDRP